MADALISVIIVTYNSRKEIDPCLTALFSDLGAMPAQVIIIDNASTDGTPEHLASQWQQVTVLRQNRNRGFAAANNLGLAIAQGNSILLLNPDTVIKPGAISAMLTAMKNRANIGVVGPRLLNDDGSLQPSCREFPNLLTHFIGMTELYRIGWIRRLLRRGLPSLGEHRTAGYVDWLSGACLLVRHSTIDGVGGMDERYFLYGEELDWQYRMAQHGWRAWFEPSAQIIHSGGASTMALPSQRIVWQYEGIFRFSRMYCNVFQYLALRVMVWFVTLPKILFLTIVGWRNPRRQELARAFWRVLWL